MDVKRSTLAALWAAIVVAAAAWVILGPNSIKAQILPGPLGTSGEAVWPAFEGWGPLADGTNVALIGYSNENKEQELDIPIGPDNHFEPGPADRGQPTHFTTGRAWGVFALPFPKDFGNNRVTWTLTANGHTAQIQFWMNPPYWVDFFKFAATGNTPPVIRFASSEAGHSGPATAPFAKTYEAAVNQPLSLSVFVSDLPNTYDPMEGLSGAAAAAAAADAAGRGRGRGGRGNSRPADVTVEWSKYRGPGWVSIDEPEIELRKKVEGEKVVDESEIMEAKTQVWFDTPGEYWLLGQAKDQSSLRGGGDQCCWTTTHVKVNVK